MRQKLMKLSAWTFGLALAAFALSYLFFHYLTDAGFTTVWQPEAGKPYVTLAVLILGVLFFFSSILSLLIANLFWKE